MKVVPDVEAIFKFIGIREGKIFEGFRPSHLIKEDYLTTGVHNYYNIDSDINGEIKGTITFISPIEYPACLWVGKRLEIYEGSNLIGYAMITSIFNPILQKLDSEKFSEEKSLKPSSI